MGSERRTDPAGFVTEAVETLRERLAGRKRDRDEIMWLNHFDLLPGDHTVQVTQDSTSSGVGGGLTAAVIHSTTTGEVDASGGNKVVHMGVDVPPGYVITGVRVGYELTSSDTNISQIRLSQVQDPPKTAAVLLDDSTDHTVVGPIFVDSATTSVDPAEGPVLLDLRVKFAATTDKIAVRGVGLHLARR
jgi:hypothetical protein